MRHKRNNLAVLLLAAALIGVTAGCGAQEKSNVEPSGQSDAVTAGQGQAQANNGEASASAKTKQTIHVYYTDADLTVLVEQSREIEFGSDNEKIAAALQALQSDAEGDAVSVWHNIEWLASDMKDGAVTIDLHLPDGSRLGAPGEVLALEALKKTLFQFNEVTSINVLVDGEAAETLMGHEELPHPIVR